MFASRFTLLKVLRSKNFARYLSHKQENLS